MSIAHNQQLEVKHFLNEYFHLPFKKNKPLRLKRFIWIHSIDSIRYMKFHEAISKIEKWFEVKELLKRTAEYPPAMQVLGSAIITVALINIWGVISNPIKGIAGRSNKE